MKKDVHLYTLNIYSEKAENIENSENTENTENKKTEFADSVVEIAE